MKPLAFLSVAVLAPALPAMGGAHGAEVAPPVPRWPSTYEGRQRVPVERLADLPDGQTGFASEGYRFIAHGAVSDADWRTIIVVCEGVRGALASLPIGVLDPALPAAGGGRRETVRIFPDDGSYHAAGGLEDTLGTYLPRTGEVLIWARGLDEPDPERGKFRLPKRREFDLLVHELTHQLSASAIRGSPVWFSEGLAEYLAAAHFAPGRYSFRDPTTAIRGHAKKFLGAVAAKDRFAIVPLETLVRLDARAWAANTRAGEGHGPYLKYTSALLLFHYFCHLDPRHRGGALVREFTGELRRGTPGAKATVTTLLRERGLAEIEAEIESYWRANGLRVDFR